MCGLTGHSCLAQSSLQREIGIPSVTLDIPWSIVAVCVCVCVFRRMCACAGYKAVWVE